MANETRARYRKEGRCKCGNYPNEGKEWCEECLLKARLRYRNKLKTRSAKGKCVRCQKPTGGNRSYCEDCSKASYRYANERYHRRVSRGRCPKCGGAVEPDRKARGRKWCLTCVEISGELVARKRRERFREGLCVRCGKDRDEDEFVTCVACRARERVWADRHKRKKALRSACAALAEVLGEISALGGLGA